MISLSVLKNPPVIIMLILLISVSKQIDGQTSMGILPVNSSAVGSSVLNIGQWQWISFQMHDLLITELAEIGTVSNLSREHILLLLKEIQDPDPENLNAETYKIISRKENLHYLLKCSIESIDVINEYVQVSIRVLVVDGNNGKVFWEKVLKANRIVSNPEITEKMLLDEVIKPAVKDISKELKSLKY
jgi:hypothetical protein